MSEAELDELKKWLGYDSETGFVLWLQRPRYTTLAVGSRAGVVNSKGYRQVKLHRRVYLEHRLAWFLAHGKWPDLGIDHIDGDKTNNKLANLRLATVAQNQQNRGVGKDNRSGFTGVSLRDPGKWKAQITVNNKKFTLGSYATPELAAQAYADAKARLHTFHPNPVFR